MSGAAAPPDSRERFRALWPRPLPLVGMVHLLPLPGSPRWGGSLDAVLDRARADARALEDGGLDGLLVENYGDVPFHPGGLPQETVAALAVAVRSVVDASSLPVGVNALRNDARAALGAAVAAGARFIRVNVHAGVAFSDQGVLEGRAWETLRLRRLLDAPVAVLADVHVKHAVPPPGVGLEDAARDAWERGLADGLLCSGRATGSPTDPDHLRRVKAAVPGAPVWVASGLTPEGARSLLSAADGAVVGSALQRGGVAGAGVDPERVGRMVDAVEALREGRRGPRGGVSRPG